MATETAWHMRGDVMEACSCATTCPCNFGSDPIPLPCEVVLGWQITDGHYGNTRLDGRNVVLYGRMPGNAFQGNWTVGVYLDQNADQPAGAGPWEHLLRAGRWLAGSVRAANRQSVGPAASADPVRDGRRGTPHHGAWAVGGRVGASTKPVVGTAAPRPKVSDPAVPFYTGAAHVRRSRTLKLTDPNMAFEYSNRSSLIGNFDYSGP
jgi:hypothetical protein